MRISNVFWISFLSCLLSACVNTSQKQFSDQTNEKILISSNNQSKLIDFYKLKLKEKESREYRISLVKTYENVGDYTSAIFYLQPLLTQFGESTFDVNMLMGKAYLNTGDYAKAQFYLQLAHRQQADNAIVLNLLGVLSSYQGQLDTAKNWFIAARNAMGDDRTVINNLGLVALLQGDYHGAKSLFESLMKDKSALSSQVKANLAIVYTKLGEQVAFNQLVNELDQVEQKRLYHQLQNLELVDIRQLSLITSSPNGAQSNDAEQQ